MRLVSAYLLSISLFGILFPALGRGIGPGPDRLFVVELLRYGVVSIVLGSTVILFGFPLAPRTERVVVVGPYSYTWNPMLFGLLLLLVGWGIILGSVSATLFSSLMAVALLLLHCNFFEEPGLLPRFGEEYEGYHHQVPLILPFKRRGR